MSDERVNLILSIEKAGENLGSSARQVRLLRTQVVGMINVIKEITSYTDRYISSQNILNNTLGTTSDTLQKYMSSLSKMTGISTVNIAEKTALFSNMATSLGMASDVAEDFIIKLDDMSAKMALLYGGGKGFENYAKAILDAVKGESSTLATMTGIVIKAQSLQNALNELGINAQVKELDGASKAMLQYIVIARQMNATNEDLQQSANNVAWQKQLLKNQVRELALAFSNLLYPILKAILPVLNGILIALTYIINTFARFLGITTEATVSATQTAGGFGDLADGINKTNNALKKLRGFDKLNNLLTPTSGSSGVLGGLNITGDLLNAMATTNQELLNIKTRAHEIADSIMEWLGFTQDANGEWKFTEITLGTILGIAGGIFTTIGLIGGAIGKINGVLTLLGGAGLITKGATLGGILEGIAGTVVGFVSSPVGIGALFVAFSLLAEHLWNTSDSLDIARNKLTLWGDASAETKDHLQTVQASIDELRQKVDYFSYRGLEISPEEFESILTSINGLRDTVNTTLDEWYLEQLGKLEELYDWEGADSNEQYNTEKEKLKTHLKEKYAEFSGYVDDYEKKATEFWNNDKKLSTEERLELLDIQRKIQGLSIESLTKDQDEKERLTKNFYGHIEATTMKESLEILKTERKNYDDRLKEINEFYDKHEKKARETYGKDTENYKTYMNELVTETERMKNDATKEYDEFYDGWAKQNDKLSVYVDKTTGDIADGYTDLFHGYEGALIGISADIEGTLGETNSKMINEIKKRRGEILQPFEKADFLFDAYKVGKNIGSQISSGVSDELNRRKTTFSLEPTGSGATLKMDTRANGGFVDSGEIYMARENGLSEFIGRIGNRTAVANNDQIVEAVASGVSRAINTSKLGSGTTYVKAVFGSDEVTDWVVAEKNKRDRQYGF